MYHQPRTTYHRFSSAHPTDLLATVYHSVGISPDTIVYNHLNQPRELVKGGVIGGVVG